MNPRIVGMRERETHLGYGHQHTRNRCPESNQQQRRGAGRGQLQDDERRQRRRQDCFHPMLNEWNRRYRSQEYESGYWPTLRKCREKPLHKRSRTEPSWIQAPSKTLKSGLSEPLFRGAWQAECPMSLGFPKIANPAQIVGRTALVPLDPLLANGISIIRPGQADEGVGCGPGGPPHN